MNKSGKTNTEIAPRRSNERTGLEELQCCWCSKWFGGGQALGGHIRVHKAEPDYPTMPKRFDPERTLGGDDDGNGSGDRDGVGGGGNRKGGGGSRCSAIRTKNIISGKRRRRCKGDERSLLVSGGVHNQQKLCNQFFYFPPPFVDTSAELYDLEFEPPSTRRREGACALLDLRSSSEEVEQNGPIEENEGEEQEQIDIDIEDIEHVEHVEQSIEHIEQDSRMETDCGN